MEISLRSGEALRIENQDGKVLTLLAPRGTGSWEIRVDARRDSWWKRWIRRWFRAMREDRAARELALLDERLLADIGLGANSGHPMATRVQNYRQQERWRIVMAQRGYI